MKSPRPLSFVKRTRSIEELEEEQGMYSATVPYAKKHGGPITNEIIDAIPEWYKKEACDLCLFLNIDIRVHRLYPGNYPAYPGWHCDANYRETFFGQPSQERTKLSKHIICTVSSEPDGVSNTVFLENSPVIIDMDGDPNDGAPFWAKVDERINKAFNVKMSPPEIKEKRVPDGTLTLFDCATLHRAEAARVRGWRLFFRVSMWYRPNLDGGKLSKQEMIYMDFSKPKGW